MDDGERVDGLGVLPGQTQKHIHILDIVEDSLPDINDRTETKNDNGTFSVEYGSLDIVIVRCREESCGWSSRIVDAQLGKVERSMFSKFRTSGRRDLA